MHACVYIYIYTHHIYIYTCMCVVYDKKMCHTMIKYNIMCYSIL